MPMKHLQEQAVWSQIKIFKKSFFGMIERKVIILLQLSLAPSHSPKRFYTLSHNYRNEIVLDYVSRV